MTHHLWYLTPLWGHMGPGIALIISSLESNPDLQVTLVYHACISKCRASVVNMSCGIGNSFYPPVPFREQRRSSNPASTASAHW